MLHIKTCESLTDKKRHISIMHSQHGANLKHLSTIKIKRAGGSTSPHIILYIADKASAYFFTLKNKIQ